jgi:hypothetical protein
VKMGAPSLVGFNLDQTFFGFKPKHQVQFHEQLFDLLWAGEGRWTLEDVYELPIHIRKLWVQKINKIRDNEENLLKKQQSKTSNVVRPSKPTFKK